MSTAPLTSIEIAKLEERRLGRAFARVVAEHRPFCGGIMGFNGPGYWHNQACGAGLDGPLDAEAVAELIEFYEARDVEPRIELAPFVDERTMVALAAAGFVVREFHQILARELAAGEDLEALLAHGRPPGLELRVLDPSDLAQVDLAVEMMLRGFYPADAIPSAMTEVCRRNYLLPITTVILAHIDGELAATSVLSFGEGIAVMLGVSTEPRFRRRGVQQALLVERLALARARGCRLVTIGSQPGGPTERNALRLGFRIAYTKVVLGRPRRS